ncbi:EAL domain-containing protein [Rhodoferax sp. 4810]|nr:EAL domain-containing protein [Rhodoferax jenense]
MPAHIVQELSPQGFAQHIELRHVHPQDFARLQALLEYPGAEETQQVVFRTIDACGTWQWFELQSQWLGRNATIGAGQRIGVLTDITDRQRQFEYAALQQKFFEVLAQSPDRPTLIAAMLDTVLSLSDLDGGGLYWERGDGGYGLLASHGLSDAFLVDAGNIEPGDLRAVIISAGAMVCSCVKPHDACTDPGLIHHLSIQAEGITSLVILPINVAGRGRACLNLASKHVSRLPATSITLLQSLAEQFGLAIERLTAREDALNMRQNLEGFFQALQDFVFVLNPQGDILYVNPVVYTKLGYDEKLLGKSVLTVHPERVHASAWAIVTEMLQGKRESCPLPLLRADGSELMVDTRIVHGNWNGRPALLGVSRDISEQRALELALEQQHDTLRTLMRAQPDLVWLKDPQGKYLSCNYRFEDFVGHKEAEIIGKTDYDFVSKELGDLFRANDLIVINSNAAHTNEEKVPFAVDGHEELLETIKTPLRDRSGHLIGVLGIGRDITARAQAEEERRAALDRFQKLAAHVPGVIYQFCLRTDGTSHFPFASAGIKEIYGLTPEDVLEDASVLQTIIHSEDLQRVTRSIAQSAARLTPWVDEYRVCLPGGNLQWVRGHASPLRQSDGSTLWHGYIHNSSAERKAREQLRMGASVFAHSYEGIMIASASNVILEVNPAFSRITGYEPEDVLGKTPNILSSGRQGPDFYIQMWKSLAQNDQWSGEIWNRRKSGEVYAEILSITVVRDDAGNLLHYLAVFSDITRLKAHETELAHIANYDVLTGVPNRRLLSDRLKVALAGARRDHSALAICMLDLDGFKDVNDRLGHACGDLLLIEISRRLQGVLRENDTLARLGGDEFVLLFSDMHQQEESHRVLNRVLQAIAQPMQLGDAEAWVSASIGVTLYPLDDADADTLLRHADQAMYVAKQAGKNRYHLFDSKQDRLIKDHKERLERLEEALANGELVLYYQPKVNLANGKIIGAEALIRWQHPEHGLLSPDQFLPLLSGTPLEFAVGRWVITHVLQQIAQWQEIGLHGVFSANVSADHLLEDGFVTHLQEALNLFPKVNPKYLELEILETAAIGDMMSASKVLQQCRVLGVRFALDDFGTGYSSLSYFRSLSFDVIKIDQSFVRDMLEDPNDLGIVDSVVRLAHAFNRPVIAEGVETLEHGDVLLQLGCQLAQGYGIARPMPAAQFADWTRQWYETKAWKARLPRTTSVADLPLLTAIRSQKVWMDALLAQMAAGNSGVASDRDSTTSGFSQWYHGGGSVRYGHLPLFQSIGPLHEHVQALVQEIFAEPRTLILSANSEKRMLLDQANRQLNLALDMLAMQERTSVDC